VPQQRGFSSTLAVSAKYQHLAQFSGDRIWMKIRIVGPLVAIPVQAHSELLTNKFGFLHQQSSGQQSLSSLNLESHTYAKAKTKDGKKALPFDLKRSEKRSRYNGLTPFLSIYHLSSHPLYHVIVISALKIHRTITSPTRLP
jgi:hypothetical protein